MTHGSECWTVKKKDESKLNSADMRMLRWARGKTICRLDHIRNEDIRKEAHVKPVETFLVNKRIFFVVWPLLEAKPQPHNVRNRCDWEFLGEGAELTEKEMEGQHKGRHEEIPTNWRHGTISKLLDHWNNSLPCTQIWSRKVRTCATRLGCHLYERQPSPFGISREIRSRNEEYSVELLMAAVKTAADIYTPYEKVKLGSEKKYGM